jgi:hypothetical protein
MKMICLLLDICRNLIRYGFDPLNPSIVPSNWNQNKLKLGILGFGF